MRNRVSSIFYLYLGCILFVACGSPQEFDIPLFKVEHGAFYNTLTVTGELEAVNSQVIQAPQLSRSMPFPKITQLVEDGTQVEKGDTLIQFDPSEVEKLEIDAQNELDIALAELEKAQVNNKSEIEDLEADLETAKINLQIAKLNLEQSQYKAEIDRKQIELNVENSEIAVEQARREIENRRKVQREDRGKLELAVKQARDKLDEARETMASLTILAPNPGIAILRENWQTDEKFQINDQVYSGWPLIGLPDLSLLKAETEVNEIDISRVEVGQKVNIKLDAYPDTVFTGSVKEIATLARNKRRGSSVKVFDTTVYLDGTDKRLLPGMTVSCEVLIDHVADTLFIPLEAIFFKDGDRIVYVKNGTGFDERRIEIGAESENYAIVTDGLEAGENVALIDPYAQLEKEKAGKEAGGENGNNQ